MLRKAKNGHDVLENRNILLGVKEKQNVEFMEGVDYQLYKSSLQTGKKIVAPEYNVSITHNLYGRKPDIDYNIPDGATSKGSKKIAKHSKQKYNPKFDLRVGYNYIMGGVCVNSIAKYISQMLGPKDILLNVLKQVMTMKHV